MKFILTCFIFLNLLCASEALPDQTFNLNGGLMVYRAWIPGDVPVFRGVVIGSMGKNWDYRHFVSRSSWQEAARMWGFALLGTGNDKATICNQGPVATAKDLQRALSDLATKSSHPELVNAAVCSFGFSYGATFSIQILQGMPERTLAIACGGSGVSWYNTDDPSLFARMKNVPIFSTQGDLDNMAGIDLFTGFPTLNAKGYRVALAGQWDLSHFDGNYENMALIHFDRAIRQRLDAKWDPKVGPAQLKTIAEESWWLGNLSGCEKWGTMSVEVLPAGKVDVANRPNRCWFIDETIAKTWSAYTLHHNAAALTKPFCDSTNYIPSREMLPPHPAHQALPLEATPYWFGNVRRVEFYAGTELISVVEDPTGKPKGIAWESSWKDPLPGVHALYAVLINDKGIRCVTKPCPIVVVQKKGL